jgi:hypothetical protein
MSVTINGTGNTITPVTVNTTGSVNGITPQASNMQPFNRIINGAMTIDQRNAGASTNNAGSVATYTLDRWLYYGPSSSKFAIQQSSTAPVDFVNSLLITSSAATSMPANNQYLLRHAIEGYNIADLNWGSANAKTVTLSFWVRSSLTGAFGGSVTNSDVNRSYPFSYTILLANTWEQKSVTITGPTDGSWNITNGTGLRLYFALGAGSDYNGTAGAWATVSDVTYPTGSTNILGTNGATFYITGVQLEAGSTASPFAHENYGDTLQKCQRYCQRLSYTNFPTFRSLAEGVGSLQANLTWLVETRDIPSVTVLSSSDGHGGTLVAAQQSKNSSRFYTTADGNAGDVYQGAAELLVTSEL